MNRFEIEGRLLAVLAVYPLVRLLTIQWMRRGARSAVAQAGEGTVRRWAAGDRLGRFAFAYLGGLGGGAGVFAVAWLVLKITGSTEVPGGYVALFAGLFVADWAAQAWSAREARVRKFIKTYPLPNVSGPVLSSEDEERGLTAGAPVGLFTGLGILGAVFAFVLALATYRDGLKTPDAAHPAAESSPTPPAAASVSATRPVAETPPPVIGAVAAPPPSEARPNLAPPYQNVDFSAVIQQMNDEANNLMPYSLPLPIPDDQLQDLAGKFQKMATKYFPDLAVRDSQLNREFVVRYKQRQADTPTFFDQPDWPVRLTIECVDLLTSGKTTPEEAPAATE